MCLVMPRILTINSGSLSIRFTVYEIAATLRLQLAGKIDRICLSGTNLVVSSRARTSRIRRLPAEDQRTSVAFWGRLARDAAGLRVDRSLRTPHRARHDAFRTRADHAEAACGTVPHHALCPRTPARASAAQGVERYGFRGLSNAHLMEELGRVDPAAATGRVTLAHLGNAARCR